MDAGTRLEKEPLLAVLTPRGKSVLFGSSILLALGFLSQGPISKSLIASGTFMLLLLYISKLSLELRLYAAGRLIVKRVIEGSLVEGSKIRVRLLLENPTIVPLENIEVHDYYPSIFRLENASNMRIILVRPKGSASFEYTLRTAMGKHRFPKPLVIVRDPLGLFSKTLRIGSETEVSVLPRYERIPSQKLLVIPSTKPGGLSATRRKGVGTQIFEVREYQQGDEVRRIEWKSTARLLKLMVKEFEQESSMEVIVVIDTSPSMVYGRVGYTKLEYSVRAAATIGEYLTRRGDYIGLAFENPGEGLIVIPPGRGYGHLKAYMKALSSLYWPSPEKHAGPDSYRLLGTLSGVIGAVRKRGKTVFIIFTDLEMGEKEVSKVLDLLSKMRGLGHEVLVLSPSTPFFEAKALSGLQAGLYRIRALDEIARRKAIAKLFLSRGIPIVSVGPDDLAAHALRRIELLRQVLL